MYDDDRVLVGVINRRSDFDLLRDARWYRVPIDRAPLCIDTDYLAFYLSRSVAKSVISTEAQGGVYFYARRLGFELVRRCDLLPAEINHPRAMSLYFKLQIEPLAACQPPISNPTHRLITFIYTNWGKFRTAQVVGDLYQPRKRQAFTLSE